MSEFLGSRISLISKSDIRYSGVLHEINSEESTVSLENVKSYGTEGRRGNPADEVAPSDQIYEYIVFRGSDVKDLRIEQAPAAPKENQPPMPDDPAIVGARSRPAPGGQGPPGQLNQGPPGPAGPAGFGGQNPYPPNFYPPPPGQWGRGGPPQGPGPNQGFNGMPYPPPPGWFPPGQGFPPGAPGPWNHFGYPAGPPGPHGPPGAPNAPGAPSQGMITTPQQDKKPTPIGAGVDKQKPVGSTPGAEEPKPFAQPPKPAAEVAPTPPVESKPTAAEVKATAESLESLTAKSPLPKPQAKNVPTGPRSNRITPAVPIPTAILQKSAPQATAATATVKLGEAASGPPSAAALRDATQAAKAAVAVAMAKLDNPNAAIGPSVAAPANSNAMDNLTKKVNEMRVNATRPAAGRGRGRGGRFPQQGKIEVPDVDFDFQTANAKFDKGALASPSEVSNGEISETPEPAEDNAYNKKKSFFDNIGSEAKDRADSAQKPGGREWRGEEQRKNMETFGQGSVDGGYRGGYRGRGRGRGRGNMRGRGQGRGGFRPPPVAQ